MNLSYSVYATIDSMLYSVLPIRFLDAYSSIGKPPTLLRWRANESHRRRCTVRKHPFTINVPSWNTSTNSKIDRYGIGTRLQFYRREMQVSTERSTVVESLGSVLVEQWWTLDWARRKSMALRGFSRTRARGVSFSSGHRGLSSGHKLFNAEAHLKQRCFHNRNHVSLQSIRWQVEWTEQDTVVQRVGRYSNFKTRMSSVTRSTRPSNRSSTW